MIQLVFNIFLLRLFLLLYLRLILIRVKISILMILFSIWIYAPLGGIVSVVFQHEANLADMTLTDLDQDQVLNLDDLNVDNEQQLCKLGILISIHCLY